MGPETELLVKTFGAWGIALGFCVIAIVWLVKRLAACDTRNAELTDKFIDLSRTQSADIERNTASLVMLREALAKDRQNPLAMWPDQEQRLREIDKRSGGG